MARYESSTPDQAIASRFLERDGRFARPPEFRVITESPVYDRGDMNKPGEKVPRGFLTVLIHAPAPQIPAASSGRRELAEWMLAESNPLTARVMVNRVWQWLFGQGLVRTPDNFGTTGSLPSNQALLDTLAVQFQENGWSMKALIREIVLSRAYQLSSTFDEKNFTIDPENALVWRMSKRRLDAEAIRDAILAASGQLDLRAPIGSLIAERGNGPIGEFKQFPGAGVPEDVLVEAGTRTNARSIYLPIARELLPDALAVFDFAEPGFVNGSRETTNVPSQALFLLNSPMSPDPRSPFFSRRELLKSLSSGFGYLAFAGLAASDLRFSRQSIKARASAPIIAPSPTPKSAISIRRSARRFNSPNSTCCKRLTARRCEMTALIPTSRA